LAPVLLYVIVAEKQLFITRKGKPSERMGRKATGPPPADSRVAERYQHFF
jgi:hypothetical protein